MILSHLSQKQLQDAIGADTLARLEVLAPVLVPDSGDPTELYRRGNLLKILSAFSPAQLLRDRRFMRELLDAVPAAELSKLCEATGVGLKAHSFAERRDMLVSRGWSDPNYCGAFVEAAGLPRSFAPAEASNVPASELVASAEFPFKRLKDYQTSVYNAALYELSHPRSRFLVQMPTGSGKTRTAMELICDVLNDGRAPAVVTWLAHSEELCEQAIACFREVWAHLGARPARIHRVYGGVASIPGAAADAPAFVIMGFQKLKRLLENRPEDIAALAQRLALLVVDEAHRVLAPTYLAGARALLGSRTRVMGLTATPGRSVSASDQNEALADFFFGKTLTIAPPGGHSVLSYLRTIGVLSEVRMERLVTSASLRLTPTQRAAVERDLDYPPGFLSSLGADDVRNVELVRRLKALADAKQRVLFFACSVAHSKFICALLVYLGIPAAHVDGTTSPGERRAAIDAFRAGTVAVLCNFGVLTTGFDAPKTDVVFVSRPTRSIVLYSQMIGRGLRGPAIGGTPGCTVINVIDNIEGLPDEDSIYDFFSEYWNQEAR